MNEIIRKFVRRAWRRLLIVIAVIAASVWLLRPAVLPPSPSGGLLATVEQGPLVIAINVPGTITAKDQVSIVNTLEGRTTILSLVEEGTLVQKGDKLIELDASNLQDKLVDQQIVVQNAEASFVRARENLSVVENQAQSDIEQARLAMQFADDDLRKYQQGEFPNQQKELEARIALTEEELRRAEEKYSWSQVLYQEKFLSQTELKADELAARKAAIDLELSQSNRRLLLEFTHKRKLVELNAEIEKTRAAMERTRRKAAADVVQAEADFLARQAGYEREKGKLEKIRQELTKTVIRAPQDGMVVYETSRQASWRGAVEPLAAGQEVRERQGLIYLPAAGAMLVESKVYESSLPYLKIGQAAWVTVDSRPGQRYAAEVVTIAVLPDATSAWLNPDLKLYRTELALAEETVELRTGISCRVEIVVAEFADTLSIPVQAVAMIDGQPQVEVLENGRVVVRNVQLGMSNNSRVQILGGLAAGQQVQMSPALQTTKSP